MITKLFSLRNALPSLLGLAAGGCFSFSALALTPVSVLTIGDSQSSGSFGSELRHSLAKTPDIHPSSYARPGSGAEWWLEGTQAQENWGSWDAPYGQPEARTKESKATPLLKELIAKTHPGLVIVQLGGNMVGQNDAAIRDSVKHVVSLIHKAGSACLWIGPPPGDKRPADKFPGFYKSLRRSVEAAGCHFVDTRDIVKPPLHGGDGIHLDSMKDGTAAAKNWAHRVADTALTILHKSAADASPNSTESLSKTHH